VAPPRPEGLALFLHTGSHTNILLLSAHRTFPRRDVEDE
jgi:hypothetical protein